ncbi:MAG: hypothetical protein ACOYMN_16975 [Roseimicrobium sp.]
MLAGALCVAQEPAADLRTLKAQLRRDLLKTLIPEMKTSRDQLLALENKCAAATDFAGALRARDARLKIESDLIAVENELPMATAHASGSASARTPERTELKLADAVLNGLTLDGKGKTLSGFGKAAASATWTLPDLPPGGYEVILRASGANGNAVVKESFYSLSASFKAAESAVSITLGTLRVRDGKGTLTLTANPPEECAALRVYSLVLAPAAP